MVPFVATEREQTLGREVQRTRKELQALLTKEELQSVRVGNNPNPKLTVWTFEDSAAKIVSDQVRENWQQVKQALKAYQHAVNAMWLYLHSCLLSEKLYGLWRRKHWSAAALVPREDVEAEILFMLRDTIRLYDPERGVSFVGFAKRIIFPDLTEWARNQSSVVSHPRDSVLRKTIPPADSAFVPDKSSYEPDEDVLLELIDKDLKNA